MYIDMAKPHLRLAQVSQIEQQHIDWYISAKRAHTFTHPEEKKQDTPQPQMW